MAFKIIGQRSRSQTALGLDYIDVINNFWTVLLLAACAVGALLLRIIGQPVLCWMPKKITEVQTLYGNGYTLLSSNYTEGSLSSQEDASSSLESYHLVVPVILFFMAVGYKAPYCLWHLLRQCLSLDLDSMTTALEMAQATNPEVSKDLFREMAAVLLEFFKNNRILLSISYLLVKLLACINLLAQFIALTTCFHGWLSISSETMREGNVHPYFPTLVVTEMQMPVFGKLETYVFQCLIPVNDVFIRMFVFLWYWTLFVALLTFVNLLMTAGVIFLPFLRDNRLTAYVCADKSLQASAPEVARFVSGTLGNDGAFLLTKMAWNGNELLAATLTQELWRGHKENPPVHTANASSLGTDDTALASNFSVPSPAMDAESSNVKCDEGESIEMEKVPLTSS